MSLITRRVLMVPKDANVQVNLILLVCFTSIPHLFHVLRDNQDQIYLYTIRPNMKSTQPPSAPQFPSSAGPAAQTERCLFIYLFFGGSFLPGRLWSLSRTSKILCSSQLHWPPFLMKVLHSFYTGVLSGSILLLPTSPTAKWRWIKGLSFIDSLDGWLRLRINTTEASYSIFCVLDIKGSSTLGFLQLTWGYRNIVMSEFLIWSILNSVFSYCCPYENVKTGYIKDKVLHKLKELYTYIDDSMQKKKKITKNHHKQQLISSVKLYFCPPQH